MPRRKLPLKDLVFDVKLQCRAAMDPEVIEEYRELFESSKKTEWPFAEPMEVVSVDKVLYVVNGYTRGAAAQLAGRETVEANVTLGTWEEAVRSACRANSKQGQRRSIADKRRAVSIALRELTDLSVSQIASACEVSRPFVTSVRRQLGIDPPEAPAPAPPPPAPAAPPKPKADLKPKADPKPKAKAPAVAPPLPFHGPQNLKCPTCGENDWVETDSGLACVGCMEPYPTPPKLVPAVVPSTGASVVPAVPKAVIAKVRTAYGRLVRAVDDLKLPLIQGKPYFASALDVMAALIAAVPEMEEE